MDGLRQKLEKQGLQNIEYMVINHQGAQAQRLHSLLAQKLTANITLHKQAEDQPDVWQILKGAKDDFLIYDRCGRLTSHISLPYSIIGQGHVEKAIRDTYCTRICGDCTYETQSLVTPEECKERATEVQPDIEANPAVEPLPEHPGRHHHGHHHHGLPEHPRHHHHGHHPPALGRHDGHEQHHGQQQQVIHQGQGDFDLSQMQQVAQVALEPQVMHKP